MRTTCLIANPPLRTQSLLDNSNIIFECEIRKKQFSTDEGLKQACPLRKLQMVDKLVRNCPVGITDKKHTRTTMRFCFRYSRIMFQKKKKKIYSVWSSNHPPKSIFGVLK